MPAEPQHQNVSLWDLFTGFFLVGLFGFGGIAASLYHISVEKRKWLSSDEYAQTLAIGQILPGASLINMSTIIADRGHVGALRCSARNENSAEIVLPGRRMN